MENKLITALATPQGVGGIGIIRLSGEGAWDLVKKIFCPKKEMSWDAIKGFNLHYGTIEYDGILYDEVLVAFMKPGSSYTREEMSEIQCHGGFVAAGRIIELIISLGGSLASPGEFTKRAFLNGRLDLSQAEAVIETIEASGERDLDFSLRRLTGKKGADFLAIRRELVDLIARAEAAIDFPEDEIDEEIVTEITAAAKRIVVKLSEEIRKAEEGQIYRQGIKTVILGRANVGKSSLLNALLREERAIVTDIPGTTRDTIEERVILKGIPLTIVDTAGIRDTQDPIEKIGVDRSREAVDNCDLLLAVFDAAEGLTLEDQEILAYARRKKAIVLLNKCDIAAANEKLEEASSPLPYLYISAKEGLNLEALGDLVEKMFLSGAVSQSNDGWVGNLRHKEIFIRAESHLKAVIEAGERGVPLDFQVIDLRGALEAMGEINGENISSEIINRIFADFCIGK